MTRALSCFLMLCLSATSASAEDTKSKKKKLPKDHFDVTGLEANMRVLHDGSGHYVVVAPSADGKKTHFFYGNRRTFYRMNGYAIGRAKRQSGTFALDDPRVKAAEIKYDKSGAVVTCRRGNRHNDPSERTKLQDLSAKETAALIKKATFREPIKKRMPHVLARDALGIYYYVDRADDVDYVDFRLFIGEAGQMRKIPLKNIATDTVGQVFATKKGALQVRRRDRELQAHEWVQPNKKDRFDLVPVPTKPNRRLIYNTLGVYGATRLGTFCDDL